MWRADGSIRVVELASEIGAFAGKLFAVLGGDVILVEPPDGHQTRHFEPLVENADGGQVSLWFSHFHVNKRAITARAGDPALRRLIGSADVVIDDGTEAASTYGLAKTQILESHPELIWVELTPLAEADTDVPMVDLTIAARSGTAWSCGYDDHSIAPVRPGGEQAYHTAATWAVIGAYTALRHRSATGEGQEVVVSAVAASNVTTEVATYEWLVAGETVRRQTGRHAAIKPTSETWALAADGRYVNTGVGPRSGPEFQIIHDWLEDLGLYDDFGDAVFIELGCETDRLDPALLGVDVEVTAIFAAGRDSLRLIARNMTAYEFFIGGQERGMSTAIVYEPSETLADPHYNERGVFETVDDDQIGRPVTYVGAPFRFAGNSMALSAPPRLGHHDAVARALGSAPNCRTSQK